MKYFDNRIQPHDVTQQPGRAPRYDDPITLGKSSDNEEQLSPARTSRSNRVATYEGGQSTPPPQTGYRAPSDIMEPKRQADEKLHRQTTAIHKPEAENPTAVFETGSDSGGSECCAIVLYVISIMLVVITLPFSLVFCIKVIQEYERAVIFRLGRALPDAKGPGLFFIVPCLEDFRKIDLRTLSFDVPPQEVLTKDSVTIAVDAVVYWRVSKPLTSVIRVENAYYSTMLLAQTTLRNILGTKELREVLSQREDIVAQMQAILDEGTEPWGIQVERVEVKDVRLPVLLQRAMAKEAESQRDAQAKVIAAEGEKLASRALCEAAQVMSENSCALQLRYLQTLNTIAAERPSTIIFPLPINGMMPKKLI